MRKLSTTEIVKLILDGAKIINGDLDSTNLEREDLHVDSFETAHQVNRTKAGTIIRYKIRYRIISDSKTDMEDEITDDYMEVWYSTNYIKPTIGSKTKIYVPSIDVEVRFCTKKYLDYGQDDLESRFTRMENLRCTPDIWISARVLRRTNSTLYCDESNNLLIKWGAEVCDTLFRYVTEDMMWLAYELNDNIALMEWVIASFRSVIDGAADQGFPLPKRRVVFKG